jgi:hypothetical protein
MLWTGPRRVDSLFFVQRPLARRVTRHRALSVELNRCAVREVTYHIIATGYRLISISGVKIVNDSSNACQMSSLTKAIHPTQCG